MNRNNITAPGVTVTYETAHAVFRSFIQAHCHTTDENTTEGPIVALHDVDADGVAAGVVWQRACERMGVSTPQRVVPDRGRNAWTSSSRERVAAANPRALFVLDLGSQSTP